MTTVSGVFNDCAAGIRAKATGIYSSPAILRTTAGLGAES